jgi:NAD(P)-dependent dehydrogenase (short-subunit alcohol dehydrogenase family)
MSPPTRGGVVITGSSSGIGRASAVHLDSLGFRVFAGVRKEADADGLRREASERLEPLILDVTDRESIRSAAARVTELLGNEPLSGLVNNAGIAVPGPIEFLPIDELRKQLEVNFIGQVAVTQAFLAMLRRSRGRIVNIGSIGGEVALPFMGPYAASKFAMEGWTDSLRRELQPLGVEVSIVRPGPIATSIWERGSRAADELLEHVPAEGIAVYGPGVQAARAAADQRARDAVPAHTVAKVVEHALTAPKPRTRYLVGPTTKTMLTLKRLLPDRAFDRLIARAMRRMARSSATTS